MDSQNRKQSNPKPPPFFRVSVKFVSLPDSEKRLARAYELLLQKVRKLEAEGNGESEKNGRLE